MPAGEDAWTSYFGGFLAADADRQHVGGVALVAMLNHAPIAQELREGERDER